MKAGIQAGTALPAIRSKKLALTLADHARLVLFRLGSLNGPVVILLPDLNRSPGRWLQPGGLASRLAGRDMDVFVLAWRGSEDSWPPVHRRSGHGLAELAGLDLPAVAERVRRLRPGAALGWIAEGGALLALWRFSAQAPHQVDRLASIDADCPPLGGWRRWLAQGSLLVKGYIPGRKRGLGGCDLSAPLWRDLQRRPDIAAWIADGRRHRLESLPASWPPSLYWQSRSPARGRARLEQLMADLPCHETRIHWMPRGNTEQLADMLVAWHAEAGAAIADARLRPAADGGATRDSAAS